MKEYNKDKIWKDVYEKKYKYKLTNKDISDNFRDVKFLFTKKDFLAAFSYWVVYQSPYDTPDIQPALKAFESYIDLLFVGRGIIYLSYDKLLDIINEKKLVNHVVFILDHSGSMTSMSKESLSNLNENIQDLKNKSKEQDTYVTLIKFNSNVDVILKETNIHHIKEFDEYNS
jgi:hypothetical protein